jgi:SPRY domain-containing SOCS box protein 1/4
MTCKRACVYAVGGYAAVRVRRPMTTGVHVWAVTWEKGNRIYTPHIGVGTDKDEMVDHIGIKDDSWGWDLDTNTLYHGRRDVGRVYPTNKDLRRYTIPDTFHLVLDMDEGTLSFVDGEEYLGVAFSGLRGRSLYVMASLWAGEQVSIKYHGVCQ